MGCGINYNLYLINSTGVNWKVWEMLILNFLLIFRQFPTTRGFYHSQVVVQKRFAGVNQRQSPLCIMWN